MDSFMYNGNPLYKMDPVSAMPIGEQMEEIEKRLTALYEWAYGKNVVTKTHIAMALGIKDVLHEYSDWKNLRKIKYDNPDRELYEKRADLLRFWEMAFEAACIDKASTDGVPARAIYLAKSIYGYWDTPQSKEDNKLSIEVLIKRKEELDAINKKEGKVKTKKAVKK